MALNPLYKKMYDEKWSPAYVAHLTTVTAPSIRNISRMRPQELKFLRLGTVYLLKKHIDVDLLEYLFTT